MKGSTHLAGGLLAGALVLQASGAASPKLLLPAAIAGLAALAPDWLQINLPWINNVVRGVVGHRGFSHWLLTAVIVGGMVRLLAPGLAAYVFCGLVSHIFLDMLSGGAPALWPWPGRIILANVKTSSALDTIIGAGCLVLALILILWGTCR